MCAILGAGWPTQSLAQTEWRHLRFQGNLVIADEVYKTVLTHMRRAEKTSAAVARRASWVRSRLLRFLKRSGYELARVEVEVDESDGTLHIAVDEGALDKIIFVGEDTFNTIRLQLALNLPGRVFNRPLLERRLQKIVTERDVRRARYEVVPVEHHSAGGIHLEEAQLLSGFLRSGQPHELRVYLERVEWTTGFNVGIGYQNPDGAYGHLSYKWHSILLDGDRMRTKFLAGFRLTNRIQTQNNPLGLSRTGLLAEWFSPPLGFRGLRTALIADTNLIARERVDLGLQNYYYLPTEISMLLQLEAGRVISFTGGAGLEHRALFGAEAIAAVTAPDTMRDVLWFVDGAARLDLTPSRIRTDFRNEIRAKARYYGPSQLTDEGTLRLSLAAQAIFPFGWSELRFSGNAASRSRREPFFGELSIGEGFLRATHGFRVFFRRAAGLQAEYLQSLSRDVLKASIFYDFAVFERLSPGTARRREGLGTGSNVGLGLHVLVLDAFQFRGYSGIGWASGQRPELGFVLVGQKAF